MICSFRSVLRRPWIGWLAVAVLVVGTVSFASADPIRPTAQDHNIAVSVARMITKQHLSRHPADQEISERCFKTFLKTLDPDKVYFYQSDIDEFAKHKDALCSQLINGNVDFASMVFRTLLSRIDERMATADALLAAPIDFTVDEDMAIDRDLLTYPRTPAEAQDRWRKRIKLHLLDLKAEEKINESEQTSPTAANSDSPDAKVDMKDVEEKVVNKPKLDPIKRLSKRYHGYAKRMHQTENLDLLEMYLNSFTTSFDPHSDYMAPRRVKNFDIQMSLKLDGIGASLQSDDGYTVVRAIVRGGAAEKNGQLSENDKIIGVGQGDEGEIVDVVDMRLDDVVDMIRGERGSTVRLQVLSAKTGETKTIKIVREKIELKDSEAQGKVFEISQKPDGSPYRLGVIELPSFYMDTEAYRNGRSDYKSTTRDVRNILDVFIKQGVDAVVLDLRKNGGGSLSEAINLTGLFTAQGPVVQVKGPDGRVQQHDNTDLPMVWTGPLVVMTSKFSASASEILAGAVQDYGRGLIVGDHSTHGKGTVQSVLDIGEKLFGIPMNSMPMGALKVTIQQFYRPNGDSTQKRGVVADIELPSITASLAESEADLDYPVEFDKVKPANFRRFGLTNPAICDQLRQLSKQRVQESTKFQDLVRLSANIESRKNKKTMPLNEAKYLEQAELNAGADKKEKDTLKEMADFNGNGNTGVKRDFYLDEVLAITTDYLNLQRHANTPQTVMGQTTSGGIGFNSH